MGSCRHGIYKRETGLPRDHAHQVLALACNLKKSTKVPSRVCSSCNKQVNYCLKALPNGKLFPSPFCLLLGSTLCAYCSVKINRQERIKDTKRILARFMEPVTESNMKEQALYSRLNYIDEEQMFQDERSSYDDDINNYSDLPAGSIARNNTPDVSYSHTCRKHKENNEMFCHQPIKKTLKRVSLMMELKNKLQKQHLDDCSSEIWNQMNLYSRSRNEINLPELDNAKLQHNNFRLDNKGKLKSQNVQKSCDLKWPTQSRLNTEELTQKISDVFEQRYLPPANRYSTLSIESTIMDVNLPSIENDEYRNLKSLDRSCKNEWDRTEDSNNKSNGSLPPVIKVKKQLPRQKMVSNVKSLLPNHCVKYKI